MDEYDEEAPVSAGLGKAGEFSLEGLRMGRGKEREVDDGDGVRVGVINSVRTPCEGVVGGRDGVGVVAFSEIFDGANVEAFKVLGLRWGECTSSRSHAWR